MYFYNPKLSVEENMKKLIHDYNIIAAGLINNKVAGDTNDISNKADIDYVAMMTDVDLPDGGAN